MRKRIFAVFLLITFSSQVFAMLDANKNDSYLSERLSYLLTKNQYVVIKDTHTGMIHNTRATNFKFDPATGLIVRGDYVLEGYADRSKIQNRYEDIRIPTNSDAPKPTSILKLIYVNLSANERAPIVPVFDPNNANTFNSQASARVYDSLGNEHILDFYYVRKADNSLEWQVPVVLDGKVIVIGEISFGTSGTIQHSKGLDSITITNNNATQEIMLDIASITEYATSNQPGMILCDGNPSGNFYNYEINDEGVVYAKYTNGQIKKVHQVALIS